MVLCTDGSDGSEHQAVEEQQIDGAYAGGDAPGKRGEADADVVGHDGRGGLRLDAEDRVHPEMMLADALHLFSTEKDLAELWMNECDEGAQGGSGNRDGGRQPDIAGEPAQQARVPMQHESPQTGER